MTSPFLAYSHALMTAGMVTFITLHIVAAIIRGVIYGAIFHVMRHMSPAEAVRLAANSNVGAHVVRSSRAAVACILDNRTITAGSV